MLMDSNILYGNGKYMGFINTCIANLMQLFSIIQSTIILSDTLNSDNIIRIRKAGKSTLW